jgi:ATP-binding cassette subfamily C (CFTR/MRP) protein 4
MAILDEMLPVTLFEFITTSMWVLGILISAIYINYLIAIFVVPLFFLFVYARKYYLPTSNDLKRIDGIYRSPVLVAMTNTLLGMSTIRSSQNEQTLKQEFERHINQHNKAYYMYIHIQKWFQLRLDLIASIYSALCVVTSILAKEKLALTAGQIGLLLTYCLNLTSIFQWCIRQSCEVENLMTSVERILEYVGLPDESGKKSGHVKQGLFRFQPFLLTHDTWKLNQSLA